MSTTFKISTGLRDHLLATGPLNDMDGYVIRIYDDTAAIPTSADDAIPGTSVLLCVLTKDGGVLGLNFDGTPTSGVMSKASTEEWLGTILASGTASYFRMSAIADALGSSTTELRFQGTVGLVNADFLVRDVVFVLGDEQRADSCNIGMPENG